MTKIFVLYNRIFVIVCYNRILPWRKKYLKWFWAWIVWKRLRSFYFSFKKDSPLMTFTIVNKMCIVMSKNFTKKIFWNIFFLFLFVSFILWLIFASLSVIFLSFFLSFFFQCFWVVYRIRQSTSGSDKIKFKTAFNTNGSLL